MPLGMIIMCRGVAILPMPISYLALPLNSEGNEPHGISDKTVRIIGVVCPIMPTFLIFSNKSFSQCVNLSQLFKNDNFFFISQEKNRYTVHFLHSGDMPLLKLEVFYF